jgi:hypothetical protein
VTDGSEEKGEEEIEEEGLRPSQIHGRRAKHAHPDTNSTMRWTDTSNAFFFGAPLFRLRRSPYGPAIVGLDNATLDPSMFSRGFLESLTIALPDGRYRVRPNGRWGRTYVVDRPTRDRLIRFQRVYGWLFVAAIALAGPAIGALGSTPVFVALAGAALGALAMIGTRFILRGAERLPKEASSEDFAIIRSQLRAQRPRRMHPWLYRPLMTVCIAGAIFFAVVCLGLAMTGDTPPIALLTAPLFFALLAGLVRLANGAR